MLKKLTTFIMLLFISSTLCAEDAPLEVDSLLTNESRVNLSDTLIEDRFDLNDIYTLNLDECIELALKRNRKIKASDYAIQAAEFQLKEAKALFKPVLDYKYQMAPVPDDVDNALKNFFIGNLTMLNRIYTAIAFPVATFGQLKTAQELARVGINVSIADKAKTQAEVIYETKQLYYGIQFAYEVENLIEEAVKRIDDYLGKQNDDDFDSEDADSQKSPFDLTKLRMFKNELRKRMLEIDERRELAFEGLRIHLGLPVNHEIRLDDYRLKPRLVRLDEISKFVEESLTSQPDRNRLEAGIKASKLKYKLEKLKLLPKAGFAFFVEYGATVSDVRGIVARDDWQDPFNFKRAGIGLQLSGQIDFHGSYSRIKKARAEYYKSLLEGSIAHDALNAQIKKLHLKIQRAEKELSLARQNQSMANQMLFLSKSNMELGIGENGDYVDSLKALLLSRGEYYNAIFNYNTAQAELEKEMSKESFGKLTKFPKMEEHDFFRTDIFDDITGNPEVTGEF